MTPTRKPIDHSPPRVLATDLDGTFLPLDDARPHREAMERLRAYFSPPSRLLVFVTGRHAESVQTAMAGGQLCRPDLLICDVGTSIFKPDTHGQFVEWAAYREHLAQKEGIDLMAVRARLKGSVEGLELQEPEKQGAHKLSYYCEPAVVDELVSAVNEQIQALEAPYTVLGSIDPFTDDGLIDILPEGVDKAYALAWLSEKAGFLPDEVVYAGDSGNDLAALTSGWRAIVVGNASPEVKHAAAAAMKAKKLSDHLYHAQEESTSGVLEGCRHFGATV